MKRLGVWLLGLGMLSGEVLARQQVREVAPLVSAWDYGENRCLVNEWGYPSERLAAIAGMNRHYVQGGCPATVAPRAEWGGYGACGSSQWYPKFDHYLGVENINTRHYRVDYSWRDEMGACKNTASDGLTVYRRRDVRCPEGYEPSGGRCVVSDRPVVNPLKNSDTCLAGSNGSNPIHSALGTKHQRERDFSTGAGIVFERYYSSAAHMGNGRMGQHWRHGYERSIRFSDGRGRGGIATAWAIRPNGDSIGFTLSGQYLAGVWQADPDIRERLEKRLGVDGAAQGWILTTADDLVEIYDEDGILIELFNPDSGRIWLNYSDDTNLLESVEDASGRKILFSYDEKYRVASIDLNDGIKYLYKYNENGNLEIVDAPAMGATRHQRRYLYEDMRFPHALTGILLDGVQYAYWDYDSQGRAIRSGHGARGSGVDLFQFEYHDNGTTTITDSLGQRRNYRFHLQYGTVHFAGLDVACSFCSGNAQSITYDDYGFVDKEIDFSGAVVDHEHDAYGRQIRKVEAADNPLQKRTTLIAWHEKLHRPLLREVLDAKDVVVSRERWRYTQRGQLLDYIREDPSNGQQRRTHYRYCEADDVTSGKCPREGLLLEVDGARTDVADITRYQYYSGNHPGCDDGTGQCTYRKGDLWRITNAIGQVTEFLAYDGAGRPLSWRDANGLVTRLGYHARGWLAERSEHDGDSVRRWRFGYTASGKLQQIIQPNGDELNFSYDNAQRLISVRDSRGNQIKYTLDAAGNRIMEEIFDSGGQLTYALSRNYNNQGWLHQATDAYGHDQQYAYDSLGRLRRVTDALGHIDSYQYDALSRPEKILGDVGRIGATTMVAYDALDQVIRVIDPKGLETRYQYNPLGDLINQYSPDTGGNVFTHDANGNRVSATDAAGITRHYHYDALNRLTRIEAPGALLGYGYDHSFSGCPADARYGMGKLTRIYSQDNQAHYCYDRYGQVVAMQQAVGHSRLWQKYQYDISGKRTGMTFPDGAQVKYQRNLLGEISSIHYVAPDGSSQTVVEAVQYVPFGASRGWRYGNGRLLHRRLDKNYRIRQIHDNQNGGLNLNYHYDGNGQLVKLFDHGGQPLAQYRYDGLGRLIAHLDGQGQLQRGYQYDATGNRIRVELPSGYWDYSYPAQSHRLASVAGNRRNYLPGGQLAAREEDSWQYRYDAHGRLIGVSQHGFDVVSYGYNARGEQVRRERAGNISLYMYDETGKLLGEYDYSGSPKQQIIWLDDYPVAVVSTSAGQRRLDYIEPDHLGTPRVIIDGQRNIPIWQWPLTAEAFGASMPDQDPDGDGIPFVFHLRYPGQRHDPATGLNYNYYRDYEPKTGRYIQSDPIGLEGGISTYGYVEGNPLEGIDPYGLEKWICRPVSYKVTPIVNYHSNRSPTCDYECESENSRCGRVKVEASPNYTYGQSQCAGADLRTRVTHSGEMSTYSVGVLSFYVETDGLFTWPLIRNFNKYPYDLVESLRRKEVESGCCK